MTHRPQLAPFVVNLRPSRGWLAGLLLLWLLLVLAVVMYLPPLVWGLLPVQTLLVWQALRADGWWQPARRLQVDAYGQLQLLTGTTAEYAVPQSNCFITPWLIVLNVMVDGRRRAWVLWPDSASAESLRALRVYLLWFRLRPDDAGANASVES